MAEEQWDAIIAGCGLAGLSLAYALSCERTDDFKILLLDREKRRDRDHTWCFWEKGEGQWDNQLSWEWSEIQVGLGGNLKNYPMEDYRYKYLESDFFYQQAWSQIDQDKRFEFLKADIESVQSTRKGAVVTLHSGEHYEAPQVFSSIPPKDVEISFWQHFLGWEIQTTKPVFDASVATLMDFQPDEDGEVRFMYILPVSENEALVEFTVFGPEVWKTEVYFEKLSQYLREDLEAGSWMVTHEEVGAIPMSCELGKQQPSGIRTIGTAGGVVKPSTGYAFSRIQRDSLDIAQRWKPGKPVPPHQLKKLYSSCDAALLHLMEQGNFSISAYFASLFERWGGDTVLGFLDEQLPTSKVLGIMNASPWKVFIPAWLKANFGK